jgi:hypothetical protein
MVPASGRDELPLIRVFFRSRTRRRPRPRYRVFFPSVFEHPKDLIFAKTPRFATSVLSTWLFEDDTSTKLGLAVAHPYRDSKAEALS